MSDQYKDLPMDLPLDLEDESNGMGEPLDLPLDFGDEKDLFSELPVDSLDEEIVEDIYPQELPIDEQILRDLPELDTSISPFSALYEIDDEYNWNTSDSESEESKPPKEHAELLRNSLIKILNDKVISPSMQVSGIKNQIKIIIQEASRNFSINYKLGSKLTNMLFNEVQNRSYKRKEFLEKFAREASVSPIDMKKVTLVLSSLYQKVLGLYNAYNSRLTRLQEPVIRIGRPFNNELESNYITLSRYLDTQPDNIVYLNNLRFVAGKGYECDCGNCGEMIDSSPITMFVYTTPPKLTVVSRSLVCGKCFHLNLLESIIYDKVKESIRTNYQTYIDTYAQISEEDRLSSVVNYMLYEPPSSVYPEKEVPSDATLLSSDQDIDMIKLRNKLIGDYKQVKDLLRFSVKVENSETLVDLVRYMCLLNNVDYVDIFSRARSSLFNHLSEIRGFRGMISEDDPIELSLYESRHLLVGDYPDNIKLRVLGQFGLKSLDDIPKAMKEFEEIGKIIEDRSNDRPTLINLLHELTGFFMFLPIRSFTSVNSEGMKLPQAFSDWMDYCSNLMIVNSLSEKLMPVWLEVGSKTKNKSFFKTNKLGDLARSYFKDGFLPQDDSMDDLHFHMYSKTFTLFKESSFLRSCISKGDYFSFMHKILPMEDSTHSVYGALFKLLSEHQLKGFIESSKHKWETKDFYKFYYGDKFSSSEIEENLYELLKERVVPLYDLERNENEGIISYVERVKKANKEEKGLASSNSNFLNSDWESQIYLAAIDSVNSFRQDVGNLFDQRSFFGQMVFNILRWDGESLYQYIGLPEPSELLLSHVSKVVPVVEELPVLDQVLLNAIFTDDDFNSIRDVHMEDLEKIQALKDSYHIDDLSENLKGYSEVLWRFFE